MYTLARLFAAQGYAVPAWHNHTYTYYGRDKYLGNFGYDYQGIGSGLELPHIVWPNSDLFDCYSNFVLDNTMAKNATTVMDFLNNLWGYSLKNAKREAAELQKIMDKEGKGEKLAAWDWW